MSPEDALKLLGSTNFENRLEAARYLSGRASSEHVDILRAALARESVSWVREALEEVIDQVAVGAVQTQIPSPSPRTDAVHDVTQRLVHEIAPILGALELYARKETDSYESSRTKAQIDRLDQLLIALDRLSAASAPPDFVLTDLATLIKRVSATAGTTERQIRFQGPDPWTMVADAALLEIALSNGLRNAIEASSLDPTTAIVISWGASPQALWIAILDEGPGPPPGIERVFDLGASTKKGHAGMGLALAKQAMEAMGGEIALAPRRDTRGARLELRWPNLSEQGL